MVWLWSTMLPNLPGHPKLIQAYLPQPVSYAPVVIYNVPFLLDHPKFISLTFPVFWVI
jgi:hypothetical protein